MVLMGCGNTSNLEPTYSGIDPLSDQREYGLQRLFKSGCQTPSSSQLDMFYRFDSAPKQPSVESVSISIRVFDDYLDGPSQSFVQTFFSDSNCTDSLALLSESGSVDATVLNETDASYQIKIDSLSTTFTVLNSTFGNALESSLSCGTSFWVLRVPVEMSPSTCPKLWNDSYQTSQGLVDSNYYRTICYNDDPSSVTVTTRSLTEASSDVSCSTTTGNEFSVEPKDAI